MIKNMCPKCDSENVEYVTFEGLTYLFCHECGYDEREAFDMSGRIPGQLHE